MAKIKCIIKRPEEQYGHVTNISTTLANLQSIVEGAPTSLIITTKMEDHPDVIVIFNAEGKKRGLAPSFKVAHGEDYATIRGTSIIIGIKDNELVDLPISFAAWKTAMFEWGNL